MSWESISSWRSPEAWVSCRTHSWGTQGFFGLLLVELLDLTSALLKEELCSRCQERWWKRTLKCLLWTLQRLWVGSGERVKWIVSDLSSDDWRTLYPCQWEMLRPDAWLSSYSFLQSHSSYAGSEAQNHLPVSDVIILNLEHLLSTVSAKGSCMQFCSVSPYPLIPRWVFSPPGSILGAGKHSWPFPGKSLYFFLEWFIKRKGMKRSMTVHLSVRMCSSERPGFPSLLPGLLLSSYPMSMYMVI